MIVAANIILRSVPASEAALVHFFSGIPTIGTGTQEFPRIKQRLLMDSRHPYPRLQLKKTAELCIPEDVSLKRDVPQWKDGALRMTSVILPVRCSTQKKKNCVGSCSLPTLAPACQSVLEAKIEIPDTPVVNFAHASPVLEQDLLQAAVRVSSRMWNMQEMRLGWRTVPHNNNIFPHSTPWPMSFLNVDGCVCLSLCVWEREVGRWTWHIRLLQLTQPWNMNLFIYLLVKQSTTFVPFFKLLCHS